MIGARLRPIHEEAGLVDVKTFGVQDYLTADAPAGAALLAGVVRILAAVITRHGIATVEQLGLAMLDRRIGDELHREHAVLFPPTVVGAWGGGRASRRAPGTTLMDVAKMTDFATRYTAAWCSQDAASVASFFAANGSLKINHGSPSVGRAAITSAVQGFMTDFPDLVVKMDELSLDGDHVIYRWTLTGTNTGSGGSGNAVRISGYEEWRLGADGLIVESNGHFDEADYRRQLKDGTRSRNPWS